MNKGESSDLLRKLAAELGFDQVGISKVRRLDEEEDRLAEWLQNGYQGSMGWMARNFEVRLDPAKLVDGAKSVVSLIHNYCPSTSQSNDAPKVARYAYGRDYHNVLKKKLRQLLARFSEHVGNINGRCFVDSAPIMERQWARQSGLGWLGKNTLLIHPQKGSYYFLSELVIDIELEPDHPIKDHCGTCQACIEACPTDAIAPEGYLLDASRCISYLTIELKESIPDEFHSTMEDWVFGCDICQEVCPWNRFSKDHKEDQFNPRSEFLEMDRADWVEMTEEVFDKIFAGTPVKRTKYGGIRRNLKVLSKS